MIAPLEQASRRRLGNPHRRDCFAEFEKLPHGVREIARASLEDARSNPLGLFVWRIKNGWHELEPIADAGPNRSLAAEAASLVLLVDRGGSVVRETFSDRPTYDRRARELEAEVGPENVTRLAA